MLTKCPECDLQVSDKAAVCPHCGYPLKPQEKYKRPTNRKHRRLPNGFGQISEIKGRNLRNPFRAMVTIGHDENGRPICKSLKPQTYFKTYNEAYNALAQYNKDPYNLVEDVTFGEMFEKWYAYVEKNGFVTEKTLKNYRSTWKHCHELEHMRLLDVKILHLKNIINDESIAIGARMTLKNIFNKMYDYAIELELVSRNYARSFASPESVQKSTKKKKESHIVFTSEEMSVLWSNKGIQFVDYILIQCYSGWRPQELVNICLEDIDLERCCFTGGMKTENGFNRTVPIHSKILPLVEHWYNEAKKAGAETLVFENGEAIGYYKYYHRFNRICNMFSLNANHKPHDPRIQFITMAKRAGLDEYSIKIIVGHSISDVTERVYTKRSLDWLKEEIEKIK